MNKINPDKAQVLVDGPKLRGLDSETLSVVQARKLAVPLTLLWVRPSSAEAAPEHTRNVTFSFCIFSVKGKILFKFLSVSKGRYKCRPCVKAKWSQVNFEKLVVPV